MTTENLSQRERWEQTPRPLRYAKPRLYADDAAWLEQALIDMQAETIIDLADLRRKGTAEEHEDVVDCKTDLERLANIIREVSRARIDLAGGEGGG